MALLDLGDDLLTQVASHSRAAPELCRLAATCQLFARLLINDAASSQVAWSPALRHTLHWHDAPAHAASRNLYRALSTIDLIEWHAYELIASRSRKHTLLGRSSSASCCIDNEILIYGGTLNGNAGPLLDDLLVCAQHRNRGTLFLLTSTFWGPANR